MNASMLLLGAASAAVLVVVAEWLGERIGTRLYGVGLVAAALAYVIFAMTGGAEDWVGTEMGGVFVFAALAIGGMRGYTYLLSLGWALHVGWDVMLHVGPGTEFVPAGYIAACVGFDLVLAGAILTGVLPFRKGREAA